MAEEVKIGLRTRFRGDLSAYEKWKEDWRIVTNMVRINASKTGIRLSDIKLTEEMKDE